MPPGAATDHAPLVPLCVVTEDPASLQTTTRERAGAVPLTLGFGLLVNGVPLNCPCAGATPVMATGVLFVSECPVSSTVLICPRWPASTFVIPASASDELALTSSVAPPPA